MAGCDWYSTVEAREMIQEFHQKYARQPKEMEEAKGRHVVIMNELEDYLKREKKLLSRMEFTGSAYEGLKVGGKELEFDVMFVLNDGQHLNIEKDPTATGYGHLKPESQDASDKFKSVTERGEVLPVRVRDKFHGKLQKWVNKRESETPKLKGEIKLKYSGPAIRAIVHKNGEKWYFVDLVPAYEVSNGAKKEVYVAKPRGNDDTLWRRSFSVEEKMRLINIDGPDNGCRKKIVRILKVVRDNEPGLDKMVSFYIKNKIIEMTDQRKPSLDWSEKNIALRLKDVMIGMAESLESGVLFHPFCPSVNILQDLHLTVAKNISSRLRKIATNERIAKEKFKSVQKHPNDESTNLLEDLSSPTWMEIANGLKKIATSEKVVSTNFPEAEEQGSVYRPSFSGSGAYNYTQFRASADHYPDDDSDDDDHGGVNPFTQGNQRLQESNSNYLALGATAVGAGLLAYSLYKYTQPTKKK